MTMEISDRDCGTFPCIFAAFVILGHVGNAICPWSKGPSHEEVTISVACEQGSIALRFHICFSSLAGVMQLTACATLQNFALLAVLFPVA